jgi:hypothetical protein
MSDELVNNEAYKIAFTKYEKETEFLLEQARALMQALAGKV